MPGWSFQSSFFNFDLATLLGLPGQEGNYRVFLWLDDIVSPIESVTVPANPLRGKGRAVAATQPIESLEISAITAPQTHPKRRH